MILVCWNQQFDVPIEQFLVGCGDVVAVIETESIIQYLAVCVEFFFDNCSI